MFTLPKIAKAANFEYNTAKRWAQRHGDWFENLAGEAPDYDAPESRFATRRFGLEATKAILVAMIVAKCGVRSELAFEIGINFAFAPHGYDAGNGAAFVSTRDPGKLFPNGEQNTYVLVAPAAPNEFKLIASSLKELGEEILNFCDGDGNMVNGCTIVDLNRALPSALSSLGLNHDEIRNALEK